MAFIGSTPLTALDPYFASRERVIESFVNEPEEELKNEQIREIDRAITLLKGSSDNELPLYDLTDFQTQLAQLHQNLRDLKNILKLSLSQNESDSNDSSQNEEDSATSTSSSKRTFESLPSEFKETFQANLILFKKNLETLEVPSFLKELSSHLKTANNEKAKEIEEQVSYLFNSKVYCDTLIQTQEEYSPAEESGVLSQLLKWLPVRKKSDSPKEIKFEVDALIKKFDEMAEKIKTYEQSLQFLQAEKNSFLDLHQKVHAFFQSIQHLIQNLEDIRIRSIEAANSSVRTKSIRERIIRERIPFLKSLFGSAKKETPKTTEQILDEILLNAPSQDDLNLALDALIDLEIDKSEHSKEIESQKPLYRLIYVIFANLSNFLTNKIRTTEHHYDELKKYIKEPPLNKELQKPYELLNLYAKERFSFKPKENRAGNEQNLPESNESTRCEPKQKNEEHLVLKSALANTFWDYNLKRSLFGSNPILLLTHILFVLEAHESVLPSKLKYTYVREAITNLCGLSKKNQPYAPSQLNCDKQAKIINEELFFLIQKTDPDHSELLYTILVDLYELALSKSLGEQKYLFFRNAIDSLVSDWSFEGEQGNLFRTFFNKRKNQSQEVITRETPISEQRGSESDRIVHSQPEQTKKKKKKKKNKTEKIPETNAGLKQYEPNPEEIGLNTRLFLSSAAKSVHAQDKRKSIHPPIIQETRPSSPQIKTPQAIERVSLAKSSLVTTGRSSSFRTLTEEEKRKPTPQAPSSRAKSRQSTEQIEPNAQIFAPPPPPPLPPPPPPPPPPFSTSSGLTAPPAIFEAIRKQNKLKPASAREVEVLEETQTDDLHGRLMEGISGGKANLKPPQDRKYKQLAEPKPSPHEANMAKIKGGEVKLNPPEQRKFEQLPEPEPTPHENLLKEVIEGVKLKRTPKSESKPRPKTESGSIQEALLRKMEQIRKVKGTDEEVQEESNADWKDPEDFSTAAETTTPSQQREKSPLLVSEPIPAQDSDNPLTPNENPQTSNNQEVKTQETLEIKSTRQGPPVAKKPVKKGPPPPLAPKPKREANRNPTTQENK